MSSSEPDQEDVGATASSSEPDEEPERWSSSSSSSSSPSSASSSSSCASQESDAASAETTTTSSVEREEAERSDSSLQSSDSSTLQEQPIIKPSRMELINNLLIKVEKDFNDICLDDILLRKASECYLDRMIDLVTLGVAFSVFREVKMGAYTTAVVHMGQLTEDKSNKIRTDIFAEYYDKERKCICSKCTKMVLASGFAIHLEVCMGIKQSRTRNARRVVKATTSTREQDSPTYESLPSSDEDDDDDADWSCGGEKRKKKRDRNGAKRMKGTPTKKTEIETSEIMVVEEVDIEGETDEIVYEEEEEAADNIFSLSEFFMDDSSQSYATASSAGTHSNTSSDEAETKIEQSSPSPTSSS